MKYIAGIIVAAGLAFSSPASASLVSIDSIYGAGTITHDTSTGIEWLDVNLAQGMTRVQINALLGSGGLYDGFQFASSAQVSTLFENAGLSGLAAADPLKISRAYALIALLGTTWISDNMFPDSGVVSPVYGLRGLIGLEDGSLGPTSAKEAGLYVWGPGGSATNCPCVTANPTLTAHLPGDSFSDPVVGAFLVRLTPAVPEPSTWLMMILGFAAVGFMYRRRLAKSTVERAAVV